jgi:hypothetical protein
MIGLLNRIIEFLGDAINALLSILPTSPFHAVSGVDSEFLQAINYLFPVTQAIAHLELFVTAVAIYYGLRVVLKWGKVAGD